MTRIPILIAGSAGAMILWWTAKFYNGVDPLAFGVVCLMAVALLAGLVELLLHSRRIQGLENELAGLTQSPSLEGIDGASPMLRALLRARLDRVPLGVPRASFTPYLIGLLVMLGLLGTFLGLFETLRGASLALTASSDVEALREGLSTPMSGLMRSFGTSAAGVSSSAMLGLAAVFSRRSASHFGVQLHAAASGPYAHFASSHRQLMALEQLAVQGESWPAAAAALTQASKELLSLREEWRSAHQTASQDVLARLNEATASVQQALERGIDETAKATHAAVAPLLEQAVSGTVNAAGQHLAKIEASANEASDARRESEARMAEELRAHLERVTTHLDAQQGAASAAEQARREHLEALERDAEQAREAHVQAVLEALREHAEAEARVQAERSLAQQTQEAARAETWLAALSTVESSLVARGEALDASLSRAGAALVASLEKHAEAAQAQEAARANLLAERMHAVTAQLEGTVATLADAEQARAALLAEHVSAMSGRLAEANERLGAEESRRAEMLTQHVDAMSQEMRRAFNAAADRDSERAETLAKVAGTLRTELSAAAEVMRDRLGASADADAERAKEAQAMFEELKVASKQIAEAASTQSTALQQFVAATEGRTEALETRSQERLEALLDRVRETVDHQAARLGELEGHLRDAQAKSAEALAASMSAHATALSESLGQTSQLVQNAAGLVQAGGAELTAVAEMFAEAVDRQRDAAREWMENLGHVERAVADAGEGAAADALGQHLARTHEIFDRQLRFQQELFEQLRHARNNPQPGAQAAQNELNGSRVEHDVSA